MRRIANPVTPVQIRLTPPNISDVWLGGYPYFSVRLPGTDHWLDSAMEMSKSSFVVFGSLIEIRDSYISREQ